MGEFRPSYQPYGGGRNPNMIENSYPVDKGYKDFNPKSRAWNDLSLAKKRSVKPKSDSSEAVKSWWKDPESKRKRRVAMYKVYTLEGKIKGSIKKASRWFKKRCSKLVHGFFRLYGRGFLLVSASSFSFLVPF